ncbi:hypothetical protein [Rhodococcus sp. X156]|nr:hypothetical protein [Rhodococcus sp. X156]
MCNIGMEIREVEFEPLEPAVEAPVSIPESAEAPADTDQQPARQGPGRTR